MPPSGYSKYAVEGSLQFIRGCYLDLLEEVRSGKHRDYESAIEFELRQIGSALEQIHIDRNGRLVKRKLKRDRQKNPMKRKRNSPDRH